LTKETNNLSSKDEKQRRLAMDFLVLTAPTQQAQSCNTNAPGQKIGHNDTSPFLWLSPVASKPSVPGDEIHAALRAIEPYKVLRQGFLRGDLPIEATDIISRCQGLGRTFTKSLKNFGRKFIDGLKAKKIREYLSAHPGRAQRILNIWTDDINVG
jgi:hypothetical protein